MQLWWILAHAFMGDVVGAIVHTALTEESGDINFRGAIAFWTVWFVTGPLLAFVQWLYIRRLVSKTEWFAGTVVGWWLGIPIGMQLPIGIGAIALFCDLKITGSSSELMFHSNSHYGEKLFKLRGLLVM